MTPTDGGRVDSGDRDGGGGMDAAPVDAGMLSAERYADAIEASAEEYCACFFMDDEWSSAETCVAAETHPTIGRACYEMVYPMHAESLSAYFACFVTRLEALNDCLDAAMCMDAALTACEAMPDPFECEGDTGAFDDAWEMCVGTMTVGPMGSCPDTMSVSTMTGTGVFTGTTVGRGNDLMGDCGGDEGADVAHQWRATLPGTYVIDTEGTAFDTVLYVRNMNCMGMQLECDDDTTGLTSEVMVTLTAGQEIIIVVDGFDATEGGTYAVNIRMM